MWPNLQETADLFTFTGEILMENFMFCPVYRITTGIDGLGNSQVNIYKLEDYVMSAPEFHLEISSRDESECEEWVSDNDSNGNNNCTTDFEGSTSDDNEKQD